MVLPGIIKNSCYIILLLITVSCNNSKRGNVEPVESRKTNLQKNPVPSFNADSAYYYIQRQVEFGPRVPNSLSHEQCYQYLLKTFQRLGANVQTQQDVVKRHDGVPMVMKNIIASINPSLNKRVLLCAHWDTRYIADNDSINTNQPILGANDGGSGVGVLLEIARLIYLNPINIGVDFILFDVEDQGQPNNDTRPAKPHSWCLGSQYWAQNPHIQDYFADYGILLDMVGGEKAKFTKEGASRQFAYKIVDEVWSIASELGYSSFFVPQHTPPIIDDHLYINNLIHIPTINIVEYDENTHNKFNASHHKHSDNMQIIDKTTLKAVGQTVLEVIYRE